jgi:probable F420-dependent oxidoreductase
MTMRLGVTFPQTEIGDDPDDIVDFVRAAEAGGFTFLMPYDHVLGAGLAHRPDWRGPYNAETPFHEVFVLFGFLAAITRLELVSGVLVLPQRQTALVAKQAAEVDVLTRGRFRLGVGIGWNEVEYQALGEGFRDRARRYEEQIEVLRLLWTNDVVTFKGRYHEIDEAGILPRPVQQPIPIWMGRRWNASGGSRTGGSPTRA